MPEVRFCARIVRDPKRAPFMMSMFTKGRFKSYSVTKCILKDSLCNDSVINQPGFHDIMVTGGLTVFTAHMQMFIGKL